MRKPGMGCNAAMERRIKLYWAKSRGLVRSLQRKKRETVPAGTQMQGDPGGLGNSRMWFCVAAASPPGEAKEGDEPGDQIRAHSKRTGLHTVGT